MLDLVMASVRYREDFHRITYETLQQAAEHGVRHREMFWNPTTHMACGVPDETAVDGISAGIRDARADFGIPCVLIAGINRMGTPEHGRELVQTVLAHPRDEVIGIGMDYAEAEHPPEQFWKAYRLAGQRGLRRTAHASEDAPARNVETCLDLLGYERIDHCDHVLEDERITKRCADQGVVFSCCPRSTAWVYFGQDLTNHPIREMARRGLKIMVDCDDPPMFKTDPTSDYMAMAQQMGFGPEDVREFVLNGIDGSWLDDPTRRRWRREWSREIDELIAQLDKPEPRR
jgi:adenosine deaminase